MHGSSPKWADRFSVLCVALLGCAIFLGKTDSSSVASLDGLIFSHIALKVTAPPGVLPKLPAETRNYLGWNQAHPEKAFNDHPFLQLYLGGKIMRLLGPSSFSSRLLAALFSIAAALVVVAIGKKSISLEVGIVAGLILLFTRAYVMRGRGFVLDSGMIFFILLSFLFWLQRRYWATAVAAGVGIWMKAPVALLVYPVALIVSLQKGTFKKEGFAWSASVGLACAIGSLVWVATGYLGGWGLVTDWASRHLLGTIEGRGVSGPDFVSILGELVTTYWPWMLVLVGGLWRARRNPKILRSETVRMCAIAIGVVYLVMSAIRFRYLYYYLPIYPFLALLCAALWSEELKRFRVWVLRVPVVLASVLPVIALATPVTLSPERFPGLRKMAAVISAEAPCSDGVGVILGHQAYGGAVNFLYFLNYYTDRRISWVECGQTPLEQVHWLIVSGKGISECVSAEIKRRLPVTFRYADTFLLTDRVPRVQGGAPIIDLDFLARELRPPLECTDNGFSAPGTPE